MAKEFSLVWAFEQFEHLSSFSTKRMFGGMAIYAHGRMVMMLAESPGDREWRGKKYTYDLWNGVLFPMERELHAAVLEEFSNLFSHIVLPKWLYIPMSDPYFEETVLAIAKKILQDDERFGIYPKLKKVKKQKLAKKKTVKKITKKKATKKLSKKKPVKKNTKKKFAKKSATKKIAKKSTKKKVAKIRAKKKSKSLNRSKKLKAKK